MTAPVEGAVRLVYYRSLAGAAIERRLVSADSLSAAERLSKQLEPSEFRADVEQVIVGHWSLVGRRAAGSKAPYVNLQGEGT